MLFNSPEFLLGLLPISLLVFSALALGDFIAPPSCGSPALRCSFMAGGISPTFPFYCVRSRSIFLIGEKLRGGGSRGWLVAGVAGNVILLGYYKYTGFLAEVISDAAGLSWTVPNVILPLAISFFTFQQLAYLVDCRAGLVKESSFLNYAAFVTFFPHLIAGPITHHKEIIPQLQSMRIFRPQPLLLALGATIFLVGLFKKVAIADFLARFANPVF